MPLHGSSSSVFYIYATPEGEPIGSEQLIGRDTILLYVTTYDAISLAMTRRISDLAHHRMPKFNALLVVLEPPQNAPIVAVYRDSLPERIETCLGDQATLDGRGPFGDMRAVPGVVLLDRDGRLVYRGFGIDAFRHAEQLLVDSGTDPQRP